MTGKQCPWTFNNMVAKQGQHNTTSWHAKGEVKSYRCLFQRGPPSEAIQYQVVSPRHTYIRTVTDGFVDIHVCMYLTMIIKEEITSLGGTGRVGGG